MRDFILSEIKRLAFENGGTAPGQNAFTNATGISTGKWRGIHWLRWSDALAEAGFAANAWNQKTDTNEVVRQIAELTRELQRLPTRSEIRMRRQTHPEFPAHSTVSAHLRTNADMVQALLQFAEKEKGWIDLPEYLPAIEKVPIAPRNGNRVDGHVYLLKSGGHYKIGRSDEIERRFREIKLALPESVTLVHSIQTDDPSGIEAYWHRRFADRRANGEWFSLTGNDVHAFCRRTFQ